MTEADQYGPLWRGANVEGWHLFRIADGSVGKKPADIVGVTPDGVGVLLEVKTFTHIPARWGEEHPHWQVYATHQKAWLRLYAEACALPLCAEYNESRHEMRIFIITHPDQVDPDHIGHDATSRMVIHKVDGLYKGWSRIAEIHRMYHSSVKRTDPLPGPT